VKAQRAAAEAPEASAGARGEAPEKAQRAEAQAPVRASRSEARRGTCRFAPLDAADPSQGAGAVRAASRQERLLWRAASARALRSARAARPRRRGQVRSDLRSLKVRSPLGLARREALAPSEALRSPSRSGRRASARALHRPADRGPSSRARAPPRQRRIAQERLVSQARPRCLDRRPSRPRSADRGLASRCRRRVWPPGAARLRRGTQACESVLPRRSVQRLGCAGRDLGTPRQRAWGTRAGGT